MMQIKIQIPNIRTLPLHAKNEYKIKIKIPRVIVKETHNSRYLSCDDPRHSQK